MKNIFGGIARIKGAGQRNRSGTDVESGCASSFWKICAGGAGIFAKGISFGWNGREKRRRTSKDREKHDFQEKCHALSRKLAKKPNRREAIPEGKESALQVQGICKRDLRRMSKVLGAGSQKGGFALNSKRRQGYVYAVIPGGAGISRPL